MRAIGLSAFAVVLALAGVAGAQATPAKEPPPPPAPARLWISAPSATGPWTLRIDNEGDKPVRIPADVRLLRFEVETSERISPEGAKVPRFRTKKVKCAAPGAMRSDAFPEPRALFLMPGQSYIEEFDPRLICFGKLADSLAGGAVVRTRFGWDPPPKWSHKAPTGPFAAEGTEQPAAFAPARELTAPTMLLSWAAPPPPKPPPPPPAKKKPPEDDKVADGKKHDGKKHDGKHGKHDKLPEKYWVDEDGAQVKGPPPVGPGDPPPGGKAAAGKPGPEPATPPGPPPEKKTAERPIHDANAPRLEVTSAAYTDAPAPRNISITVTATNVGSRPTMAAIRSRLYSFDIAGPDEPMVCEAGAATHAVPRDMFRTLKPKDKVAHTVLLSEVCPKSVFSRSGLYVVTPTLHASESGQELGLSAYTGVSTSLKPTLVRVQSAAEPFYRDPPRAVKTPQLEGDGEPVEGAE